ncbi:Rha family transcriptional regulator [Methylomicrobium sp. Wu6]|uniref:Rha family transcriptional regulator n=1 Tax=Methylomicrobium sp. Wu6 TaxID=3107928 RepID=UPI002DD64C62|nr:Rha family transcriptional regulator [Methylomicrobium sp. Wu6]MEC4747716.1 Rha family transcriptional regulator [Methylomicrobium sp. Wu6]
MIIVIICIITYPPTSAKSWPVGREPTKKFKRAPGPLEIAELTGKRHDHVMIDIRKMLKALDLTTPQFAGVVPYTVNNGATKTRGIFSLPKELTLTLVTGYSIPPTHHSKANILT